MTAFTIDLTPVVQMTDEQFYQLCQANPEITDRSPDIAWVRQERWDALTLAERKAFPPLCPDFVLELRSPGDSLSKLQAKMREYIENGAQLGWLLNRQDRQVEIYRPAQFVEVLETPASLSGESVLPGFVLNLGWLWT